MLTDHAPSLLSGNHNCLDRANQNGDKPNQNGQIHAAAHRNGVCCRRCNGKKHEQDEHHNRIQRKRESAHSLLGFVNVRFEQIDKILNQLDKENDRCDHREQQSEKNQNDEQKHRSDVDHVVQRIIGGSRLFIYHGKNDRFHTSKQAHEIGIVFHLVANALHISISQLGKTFLQGLFDVLLLFFKTVNVFLQLLISAGIFNRCRRILIARNVIAEFFFCLGNIIGDFAQS